MKKDKLRQRVFESALQIVEKEGMENLNVRKIAQRSSCSLGSIYNAFGSFQDLQLHINATIFTRLYQLMDETAELAIKDGKSMRDLFRDLGLAYIAFGQKNRLLWKALFEHFPYEPVPEWYGRHIQEGIYQVSKTLSAGFGLPEAESRRILGFFWAAIHGVSAILLNKKMELAGELFNVSSLYQYVEYCLDGLFKEASHGQLVSR